MENNAPATKHDLELGIGQLRSDVKQDIEQLRSEMKQDNEQLRSEMKQDNEQLRSEMNHQYNDLVERLTDAETRIQKAFYSFAQSNNKRVTEIEGNEAALRSRLGTIEERLLEVEKRLNIPPAA
jgi:hypothetical protein